MTQLSKKFFLAWLILFIINLFVLIIVLLPEIKRVSSLDQWHLQILHDGKKQFLQWDSIHEENEFSAKLLRAEVQKNAAVPTILRPSFKDVEIKNLSSYEVSESICDVILYDDWGLNAKLNHQLMPKEIVSYEKILLIDASATMNEKKNKMHSHLEVLYKNLLIQRKRSVGEWRAFSFSNGLKNLGLWQGKGEHLLTNIVEGEGATKLLHALKQLQSRLSKPSHIVVFTDGKVTELNRGSYRSIFSALNNQSHRLSILTPEFKKCIEFEEFYRNHQVLSAFEIEAEKSSFEDKINGVEWKNRRDVVANSHFSPLAWDDKGRGYAFLTRDGAKQQIHLAGVPVDGAKNFLKQFKKDFLNPIVLSLSASSIEFDVNMFLKRPILYWDHGWFSMTQVSPGVYDLTELKQKSNKINFFHPSLGEFQVDNFNKINDWQERYPAKMRSKLRIKSLKESLTVENRKKVVQLIFFDILVMLSLLWLKRSLEGRFLSPLKND